MCGIAGIVNTLQPRPIQTDQVAAMLSTIQHRGPDGAGIYLSQWAGLGNVRLSIIDLSSGDQPIGNEDDTLWIVFNGEIFNYVELRPLLEKRGHHFKTNCDTEVILHLYEDEGPGCLQYLNGQFAIAIWNERDRSLFLARDRIGIRPLFYTFARDQLVFGSEIKAIFAHPAVQPEIDPCSLRDVFMYWSVQSPKSIFKGIFELPPAHYAILKDNRFTTQAYWSLDFQPQEQRRSVQSYLDELETLLIDSTQIRLRADVPVGAYLSGGLDSSITTAIIQTHNQNKLKTFSISFSDPAFDESPHQREMAGHLRTDHNVVYCKYQDIGAALPDVIWHTETPITRTAPVPMFLLSKLVHDHSYKVVMTGEGADEFLAGYDIFKEMKIRRFWAENPDSTLRPRLLGKIYPDILQAGASSAFIQAFFKKDLLDTASPFYSHLVRWRNSSRNWRFIISTGDGVPETEAMPSPEQLPAAYAAWPALSQAQYMEVTTFLSPYLLSSQGDRMAMGHSVEGRYPFLDYRVIEFCNRLPVDLKMPVLTEKWLLKQLGRKYLPDRIWQRVKKPYRAPIHRCFFDPQPLDYVDEILSFENIQAKGLFEPQAVSRLAQKAKSGLRLTEVEDMALVGILSAQLLCEQFLSKSKINSTIPVQLTRVVDHSM